MRPLNSCSLVLLLLTLAIVDCDEHNHRYKKGEEVVAWMNTVGPYRNRQETYSYFSLPFCVGTRKEISHHHETLAEHLLGIELEFSGLGIGFRDNVQSTEFCSIVVSSDAIEKFTKAIEQNFWYEMIVDDLPATAEVGTLDESNECVLYTHKTLTLSFKNDRIIEFNLSVSEPRRMYIGAVIWFSYEVRWVEENSVQFHERFNKYLDSQFFGHTVHWFSLFNSFMLVVFLVGFVVMLLSRVLRHDFARYGLIGDDRVGGDGGSGNQLEFDRDLIDEYGWKQVHGDVFRPPPYPTLLASFLGTGAHLSVTVLFLIIWIIIGRLYVERASILGAAIFLYTTLSPINGFYAGSQYCQWSGKRKWIRQMTFGIVLCPSMFFVVGIILNLIANTSGNTRLIPVTTVLSILAILCLTIAPLNLVGTLMGRAILGPNQPSSLNVNAVPRPVPGKPWYLRTPALALLGGILPFGSIFIEIYFVFTSFWAYTLKGIYYVYGFMLLIFVILAIVTSCVAIVSTYFLLNAEDHHWQWPSFLVGASIAFYVYFYSIYYFLFRTRMSGLFQTVFYFGYMAVFCCVLGIMCGTFGFVAAGLFVSRIYSSVKTE